jgi:arylsulfatase A
MNRRKFLTTMTAASVASISLRNAQQPVMAESASMVPQPASSHPNVVLFICDDLGYGDLSCYGGRLQTPNLDRLAAEGTVLTHCNTPHPTCSAARAAILTGRYASRSGVSRVFFPADTTGMNLGTPTIASTLKKQGYHTAAFGKWHLGNSGEYLPGGRGFDEYLGVPYSVDMAPLPLIDGTKALEENADRDLLTQRYTERALQVIEREKSKPFFLYGLFVSSYPNSCVAALQGEIETRHLWRLRDGD